MDKKAHFGSYQQKQLQNKIKAQQNNQDVKNPIHHNMVNINSYPIKKTGF